MATPKDMPRKRTLRLTMAQRHAHCQNGVNCQGPGCKISTGKTARKAQR